MSITPTSSVLSTFLSPLLEPPIEEPLTTAESDPHSVSKISKRPRGALSEKLLAQARSNASRTRTELIVGRATHFYRTARDELTPPAASIPVELATKARDWHPAITVLDNGLTYFPDGDCGFFTKETPFGLICETHPSLEASDYSINKYHRGKIVCEGECFDFVVSSREGQKPKIVFLVNKRDQTCEIKEEAGVYQIVPRAKEEDTVLGQDTFSCWIRHQGKIHRSSHLCYTAKDSGFLFQDIGIFVTRQKKIISLNTGFPNQPRLMTRNGDLCLYWRGSILYANGQNVFRDEQNHHYRLVSYEDGGQALVEVNGEFVVGGSVGYEHLNFEMAQSQHTQDWYYTLSSDHAKNTAALVEILPKSQEKSGAKRCDHYVIVPVSRLLATSDDVIEDVFDESRDHVVRTYHDESEALYVGLGHIVASHITEDGKNFLTQEDWENPQIEYVIVPGGFAVYKKDITETTPHEWQETQGILFTKPPPKTWPHKKRFENQKATLDYKTFIAGGQHYAFTPGQTEEGNSSPHLLWQEDADGLFRLVAGAQILTLSRDVHETYFETARMAEMRKNVLKIAELKPWADAFSKQDPVYVKEGKIWNLVGVISDFTPVMASPFSIYTAHQWRPENVIVFRKLPDGTIRPATRAELATHLDEELPPLPSPYLDHHNRIVGALYTARGIKKSVVQLRSETFPLEPRNELVTRSLRALSVRLHRTQITRGQNQPDCTVFYPTQSDPMSRAADKEGYYVPTKKDALKLYDALYRVLPKKVADQVRTIRLLPAGTQKAAASYRYMDHELTIYGLKTQSQKDWLACIIGVLMVHEVLGHGLTYPLNKDLQDLALKTLVLDGMLAEYGTTDWDEYIATLSEYYIWQSFRREQMPWGYRLVHKIITDFLTSPR